MKGRGKKYSGWTFQGFQFWSPDISFGYFRFQTISIDLATILEVLSIFKILDFEILDFEILNFFYPKWPKNAQVKAGQNSTKGETSGARQAAGPGDLYGVIEGKLHGNVEKGKLRGYFRNWPSCHKQLSQIYLNFLKMFEIWQIWHRWSQKNCDTCSWALTT